MPSARPASAVALATAGVIAAASAIGVAAAPAAAATITVSSVMPKTVAAPGLATVVFKVVGGDVDAKQSIIIRGSHFAESAVSHEVESLSIVSAGLSGGGHLALALPPLSAYPPGCERGGVGPASSVNAFTLSVPAHVTTALVVKVRVPVGFAGQTPALEVVSGATVGLDEPAAPRTATDPVISAAIPRTSAPIDGVQLAITAAADRDTYVAKGRIVPARAGAMIRLLGVGRSDWPQAPEATTSAEQTLGAFKDAMGPVGAFLLPYAKTRTNDAGRFAVRFTAPRGTVVIARTRGVGPVAAPGASCPIQLGD
ncbi:MAG: hypothetical protein AAGC46_10025 [Solirubrobacteraceae bacterium]